MGLSDLAVLHGMDTAAVPFRLCDDNVTGSRMSDCSDSSDDFIDHDMSDSDYGYDGESSSDNSMEEPDGHITRYSSTKEAAEANRRQVQLRRARYLANTRNHSLNTIIREYAVHSTGGRRVRRRLPYTLEQIEAIVVSGPDFIDLSDPTQPGLADVLESVYEAESPTTSDSEPTT